MSHRPHSRKQQVHDYYKVNGAGASVPFGVTLGLKAGTVKSWIAAWSKDGPAPDRPIRDKKMVGVRRVREKFHNDWVGNVIFAGPEVSEVRWDDGFQEFVPNRYLVNETKGEEDD